MSFIKPIKGAEALPSRWSQSEDLGGYDMPIRLEGEIGNAIVRGTIPDHIDGTFYRVSSDHNVPTRQDHSPLQGHGVVTAFRVHKGRVDFKMRYVQNDRYKLERNRGRALWADFIKDHPLNSHPCIRAVIDNTSNTNVVFWAGRLLALQETGPAWSMDPDTLDTDGVDPYGNQLVSSAMTAHPKIDQQAGQLITFGNYRDSPEFVSYAVDQDGKVMNEHRFIREIAGPLHDMAFTENWLIFCQWPASFNPDNQPGAKVLVWDTKAPAVFFVTPRKPAEPLAGSGWKPYEHRMYTFPYSSEIVHTAGAWEEDGKIKFEGTWPHDSLFPFWPRSDKKDHAQETRVDLVRFTIDPTQPHKSQLEAPDVVLDIPNEFPRIDERFYNKPYDHIFMNIFHSEPQTALPKSSIWQGLNATAMLIKSTGELKVYSPGPQCRCQEPAFIPRSEDAPEGDGHVMFAVDRLDVNMTNIVLLDTADFENPVAVVELPLRTRVQIHGNWVDASQLNGKKLVEDPSIRNLVWRQVLKDKDGAGYRGATDADILANMRKDGHP